METAHPSASAPVPDALLDPAEARRLAVASVGPTPPATVPLVDAAGLVLVDAVVAGLDLPPFDNAAMDGFAVRAEDTEAAPVRLRLAGVAFAGAGHTALLGRGEAAAIATGACLPAGADAVVPVEEAQEVSDDVLVSASVPAGRHVRRAGEDVRTGDVVLEAGSVLGPGQVAAAAALGVAEVRVHRRPVVAVVPTGDEVRPPGEPLASGQVYDAVSPALAVMLAEVGAVARTLDPVADDPGALADALRLAAHVADAVVTVGGISMGRRDLVRRISAAGEVEVRPVAVALRPAKPFALGRAFGVPLFGVPGNPAAALASFEELVRPAVLRLVGREPTVRPSRIAVLAEPVAQRPGRLHLLRAQVWREGGRLIARPAGRQGAGMVHSLARANAWAVIPAGASDVAAGAEVEVRLTTEVR